MTMNILGSLKFFVECDRLPTTFALDCSMADEVFLVNLDRPSSRRALMQLAMTDLELKLHLRSSRSVLQRRNRSNFDAASSDLFSLSSAIDEFHSELIDAYVKHLSEEEISGDHLSGSVDSYLRISSVLIEEHLIDVQDNRQALNYIFVYAFIWAYVHPLPRR